MNILFWINKSRRLKSGAVTIMLRVTIDGDRKNTSTNLIVDETLWDPTRQKLKGNNPISVSSTNYLDSIKAKLLQIATDFKHKGVNATPQLILDEYLGKNIVHRTLMQAIDTRIAEMKNLVGTDYTQSTIQVYLATKQKIKSYLASKKVGDIALCDVSRNIIYEIEHYFKSVLKSNHNTTQKNLRNLKAILRVAKLKEWMLHDPFDGYTMRQETSGRTYLTWEELTVLNHTVLSKEYLWHTRNLFMFQVYTGISYQDAYNLSIDNIFEKDGRRWIRLNRVKTGSLSLIPILPVAEDVLKLYADHHVLKKRGTLLPLPSNQVYNRFIKELFKEAGITKPVSSHVARHTYATTIALSNGVPIETVSKLLGHSKISTTQIYAKVTNEKVEKDVEVLWLK